MLLAPCPKPGSEQALPGIQQSLVFVPFAVQCLGCWGHRDRSLAQWGNRGRMALVMAACLGRGNGLWTPEGEQGRSHRCSVWSLCPHRSHRQHPLLGASYLSSVVPHHPPCLSHTPRAACPSSSRSLPARVGALQAAPYLLSLPPKSLVPSCHPLPPACSSVLPSAVPEPSLGCDMGSPLRDTKGHVDTCREALLTGSGTHIFPPPFPWVLWPCPATAASA